MAPISGDADDTLHLPRIVCLHGGGVNADVFKMQCRVLIGRLRGTFRLIFVDGPFICQAHHAIVRVYGDRGPFRRWLRWLPEHPEVDAETAISEINYQITSAIGEDDARGATGECVGLLGFSQGAKISASILFTQQKLTETLGRSAAGSHYRFAVLMAGRAPPVLLTTRIPLPAGIADAGSSSLDFRSWPYEGTDDNDHQIRIPTIHVHGLKDAGLAEHRRLLRTYCEPETARVVEWDGEHRIPFKAEDVDGIVSEILDVWARVKHARV